MKTHNVVSFGFLYALMSRMWVIHFLFKRTMTQYVLWMGDTLYMVRSVPYESIYRYK